MDGRFVREFLNPKAVNFNVEGLEAAIYFVLTLSADVSAYIQLLEIR